ncbi:MAG: U32 family peptidase [Deltaproteobacteria bacterium]|nr:U32 family peptidase [Candidatus Anaeroferrophillus wilburensis]MBN2889513.1 U32 family peptidase [Deltaproteobacteria bacterium]
MAKTELLAPAGNWEKLKIAVAYGADAVYFGGEDFSLRRHAGNFPNDQLSAVIDYCRRRHVKAYLTVNCFAHAGELESLADFLLSLRTHPPDGLIVADPGVLSLCRRTLPDIPLHLSTQANTTNEEAVRFWGQQGVSRINLARELSLADIGRIHQAAPDVELEVFVHGAMCMAYSGRCLLSAVLAGRSANRGDCAHPCRWRYAVMEESRPGEYFPFEEDERGTYLFNSRDLCLLDYLPGLVNAGVEAVKIEGRMKSAYYVAVTTRVYRRALDLIAAGDSIPISVLAQMKQELTKVSHRGYTKGFIDGLLEKNAQRIEDSSYDRRYQYVALVEKVEGASPAGQKARLSLAVKDRLQVGEVLEVLTPEGEDFTATVETLADDRGGTMALVHPGQSVRARCVGGVFHPNQIFRRPV